MPQPSPQVTRSTTTARLAGYAALLFAIASATPIDVLRAQQGVTPASPAPAVRPAAAPAAPRGRRSWTSDRREFRVGELVTVLVDEYTLASANKGNSATDTKRRDAAFRLEQPPGPVPTPPMTLGVSTRNDGSSTQRGEASNENRFTGEMSTRVIAVDSVTGLLQLQGKKLVNVDKNQQIMTFTGWVRPQDVSAYNVVESARVADAELVYQAKGGLGKPKGGPVSKVIGIIWP